jgi:thiol:disulfide interchange protein
MYTGVTAPHRTSWRAAWYLAALVLVSTAATASAQGRPRADVTPLVTADGVAAGASTRLMLQVTLPEGLHVQSDRPRDPSLIPTVLTVDAPAGVTVRSLIYPEPIDTTLVGQSQPLAVFEHTFVAGAEIALASTLPPGDLTIPGSLRYQACNDRVCFAPLTAPVTWTLRVLPAGARGAAINTAQATALARGHVVSAPAAGAPSTAAPAAPATVTSADSAADAAALDRVMVLGSTGGYLSSSDFLQFIHDAERGVTRKGLFEGRGPLAILLLVLVGGIALNLTPCVLPMIPINLAIIGAGAKAGSRTRGLLLGGTYGLAMAVAYGILGLVVVLTAGTFGGINVSPWFNLAIAVLFIVLALAMFDVIVIDFSKYASGQFGNGRGPFALAFTMGALAALLAGACVAPVVIEVVLFSSSLYAGGTTIALALPFILGVGMALPWPIAGAGLASLPKPGPWMVRVKQVMGVLILVTAGYYGYVAYGLFANRWVDPAAVARSVEAQLTREGWTASLAGGLAQAEREHKPVLIDFWATWCKNCLTMDETTLANPEVKAALDGYVKIKYQAEDPDAEPAKSVLARFKAVGLPTYVIVRPAPPAASAPVANNAIDVDGPIVDRVRATIAAGDTPGGDRILAAYKAQRGVTPEWLEALSWMGRGALAAGQLDAAERYAHQTQSLSLEMLKTRAMDAEPHLPIAYGAAVEVLAQAAAKRGQRTDAILMLDQELKTYGRTSIAMRLQKNVNLLSMEGQKAPPIVATEWLGPKPPTMQALEGKVVLLFFWAHWCPDCKQMSPVLAQLADTYRDQGFVIFAPTQRYGYVAGGAPAAPDVEKQYIDQVRQQYYAVIADQPVPLDEANHLRYGVSTTPTVVLVDRAGIVRLYHPGQMTLPELEPLVRTLLARS